MLLNHSSADILAVSETSADSQCCQISAMSSRPGESMTGEQIKKKYLEQFNTKSAYETPPHSATRNLEEEKKTAENTLASWLVVQGMPNKKKKKVADDTTNWSSSAFRFAPHALRVVLER